MRCQTCEWQKTALNRHPLALRPASAARHTHDTDPDTLRRKDLPKAPLLVKRRQIQVFDALAAPIGLDEHKGAV